MIFVQLPPTPALYLVGVYARLTGASYVADCHNAMFLEWWFKWPFVKTLMKRAEAVLVHNKEVCEFAKQLGINAMVIRDPLPQKTFGRNTGICDKLKLNPQQYVIVPWNLASDEPMEEFIEAVASLPNIKFAMTWFTERLPDELRSNLPDNLIFTGYLEIDEFNDLFINAGAAISLTTQQGTQPSAAAEAIAFGVPIILSDTETAKMLYKDVPVYVENDPLSIARGVEHIFDNLADYVVRVADYKTILNRELEEEVALLKSGFTLDS